MRKGIIQVISAWLWGREQPAEPGLWPTLAEEPGSEGGCSRPDRREFISAHSSASRKPPRSQFLRYLEIGSQLGRTQCRCTACQAPQTSPRLPSGGTGTLELFTVRHRLPEDSCKFSPCLCSVSPVTEIPGKSTEQTAPGISQLGMPQGRGSEDPRRPRPCVFDSQRDTQAKPAGDTE